MLLCQSRQVEFELAQQFVVVVDQFQIDLDGPPYRPFREVRGHARAVGLVGDLLLDRGRLYCVAVFWM